MLADILRYIEDEKTTLEELRHVLKVIEDQMEETHDAHELAVYRRLMRDVHQEIEARLALGQ